MQNYASRFLLRNASGVWTHHASFSKVTKPCVTTKNHSTVPPYFFLDFFLFFATVHEGQNSFQKKKIICTDSQVYVSDSTRLMHDNAASHTGTRL